MAVPSIPPGFDFTDPDLYSQRVPAEEFAELRRTAPVWWNPQPRGASGFNDDGYWCHQARDVLEVSAPAISTPARKRRRSSAIPPASPRRALDAAAHPAQHRPAQHTKLRRIVSRGFTPGHRQPASGAGGPRRRIVALALTEGTGDFVNDVACELRCRPSPNCSGYRRKTGARSSPGRTR